MNLGEGITLNSQNTGKAAATEFMKAYLKAPPEAVIGFYIARQHIDGEPTDFHELMMVVTLEHHDIGEIEIGLTAGQARTLADGAEETMREFPCWHEIWAGVPSLIMGLRLVANKLEEMADE